MKKTLLFTIALLLAVAGRAQLYDFSAVAPSGQTLYYNIVDCNAEVTYPGTFTYSPWPSTYTKPINCLTIPDSVSYNGITYTVTSIGGYAFYGCSGLTSVTIPNTVTSIGNYAFYCCSSLTSITIPTSVISIASFAFQGCSSLNTVYYNAANCSFPNVSYNSPFYNDTSITLVVIGDSVQTIPSCFMYSCSGISDVTIPNSVTSIGNSAFWGCSGINSIDLPNSISSIAGYTFSGCSGLTSVTIPESVTSVGVYAFQGCSSLTSVNYLGTLEGWCSIMFGNVSANPLSCGHHLYIDGTEVINLLIPNTVSSVGNYAFYNCGSITSVTIPDSVSSVGLCAFTGCNNISAITVGNSVASIGVSAFSGCSGLRVVTLGSSLSSIGNSAFSDCNQIDTIICRRSYPPIVYDNSFPYASINPIVQVPCGSDSQYRTTGFWAYFTHIQEQCSNALLTANSNNSSLGTVLGGGEYQLDSMATLIAVPSSGYVFNGWNDNVSDNPRQITVLRDSTFTALFGAPIPDTVTLHDTTYVPVHDTTYIDVTDTVYITEILHDTLYIEVYLHDTIILHDTIYLDPDGVEVPVGGDFRVGTDRGMIILYGAENRQVRLLDALGRQLLAERNLSAVKQYRVPQTGVYFLQVDGLPARKVVVKQ